MPTARAASSSLRGGQEDVAASSNFLPSPEVLTGGSIGAFQAMACPPPPSPSPLPLPAGHVRSGSHTEATGQNIKQDCFSAAGNSFVGGDEDGRETGGGGRMSAQSHDSTSIIQVGNRWEDRWEDN